jgi:hypothetical protein
MAALTVIATAATIAGCATNATTTPVELSSAQALADSFADRATSINSAGINTGGPVRLRMMEYSAAITNAGMPGAFTGFVTITRTFVVQPSSAAIVDTRVDGPMTFPTPTDQQLWVAAGSPTLTPANGRTALAAGEFSFIRQGSRLTYQQAVALPETPAGLAAQILDHLRSQPGNNPPASRELRQLGYLIATAPLSTPARSAAWHVLASITGLRRCGSGADLAGRHGEGLCADSQGEEVEVLIDVHTGLVLAVEERLLKESPMYPDVAAGSLVGSTTFLEP